MNYAKSIVLVSLTACSPAVATDGGGGGETSTGDSTDTSTSTGDGDGDPTAGDGDGDPGDGDPGDGDVWAEVVCRQWPPGTATMFGRPTGSADGWLRVVADTADWANPDGWTTYAWSGCAVGTMPETSMPDSVCLFEPAIQDRACYTGGDGWLAMVDPLCASEGAPGPAWPAWLCAAEPSPEAHVWESLECWFLGGPCEGVQGNSLFRVWPTCWVDTLAQCGG